MFIKTKVFNKIFIETHLFDVLISFIHYFIFNIARLVIAVHLGSTIIRFFISQILTVLSPLEEKFNFSIPWDLN